MSRVHNVELTGNILAQTKTLTGSLSLQTKTLSGNIERLMTTSAKWGKITGDIENQTDLVEYLSIIDCGTSTEVI